MSTKKRDTVSIKDILRGKFLVGDGSIKNWRFVFFLVFLAFLAISSAHWLDKKTLRINELQNDIAQYKSKYADVHNELKSLQLEKNIAPLVLKDSIKNWSKQPKKLTVQREE